MMSCNAENAKCFVSKLISFKTKKESLVVWWWSGEKQPYLHKVFNIEAYNIHIVYFSVGLWRILYTFYTLQEVRLKKHKDKT